ncbi:Glycosyl phosphatidyl inositol anchor synthesis [Verticillium nonalfalfae]|uniref:GPI ethanolamine phosphate transferase 1 n=1 Tax=Verticillium nonalfalfae TaxID=1051616 RepID=A0A3M9Y689_9PEZI|nr:Glycosyl phosphatidyl inositol anchor synthesis [Verticillium nonalfalfae]RNJ55512.1 Glycosyl phosphatidyl inositol anchor synthesis [Verticillium nonalfalfae]
MTVFSRVGFLAIAVVFHLVYIYSIFDIYFVSPVVSGMRLIGVRQTPDVKAPADRLVLFVGDGLRADKAFQSFPDPYPKTDDDLVPRPLAPFLRSRVLEHGSFGVSHTRVPTESRPGHVALIAGLYEDVSAVATGWKLNPVNFDSVFNRSRHTWSWGSPDILPMFQQGAVPGRVDSFTYGHEFEDFSSDAIELDLWVFDHVKDFFKEAQRNDTLSAALRQDKVVFFLHLLGIDTSGHGYRPYSKEYLNNIKVVDKGVREITELIQAFYDDDRTAFVFTADHGMSDWGSHGDGHPDNTRTPLITWGSGIATPRLHPGTTAPGHDEYSSDWNMDHVQRHDVSQADIAALMAHLIGTEFPVNSVGELPLPYLSSSIKEKARASLINAREILEMYRVKEERKRTQELRYRPFGPLSGVNQGVEQRVAEIQNLIDAGRDEEAIEESAALIKVGLDGLRYLQTYDWLFLRTLITLGYLGWIAFALTGVIDLHVLNGSEPPSRTALGTLASTSLLAVLYASFFISSSPFTYYAYAFFPVVFWEEVYARRRSLDRGRHVLLGHIATGGGIASFLLNGVGYIGVIVSLALGYIHREVLTGLYVLGSLWPATYGIGFLQRHTLLSLLWFVSCLVMSIFTLLPANKVENTAFVVLGGLAMAAIGLAYLGFEDRLLAAPSTKDQTIQRTATNLPIARALTGVQARQGLPLGNQITGWIVMGMSKWPVPRTITNSVPVVSMLMPLAHRLQPNNNYIHRLMVMFLTCAPTFVILTISYEGLFYVAFSTLLVTWVSLEHHAHVSERLRQRGLHTTKGRENSSPQSKVEDYRPLRLPDARVALFFFVLLQSAFFSTGNVASVSSFSLESVNRLMPVFDPLWQGILLIVKLMVPFALISANLGILNVRLGVAPSALFMLVMGISDILTLYFFWVVKDEGSWLEIGSTISHFVIASLLCVFVALLEGVSGRFIAGIEVDGHDLVDEAFARKKEVGANGGEITNKRP